MRREELYLRDIVEAADHIADFIAGLEFPSFLQSELVRSGVVQKLGIIGEAAGHISDELKDRSPGDPLAKDRGVPQHPVQSSAPSSSGPMTPCNPFGGDGP